MSARRGLIGRLVLMGLSMPAAERAVDAFARELAEKLLTRGNAAMEAADRDDGRTTPGDPKYDKAATWYAAAKLIDPGGETP